MANRTAKFKIALTVVAGLMVVAAIGAFYQYRRYQAKLSISIPSVVSKAVMALSQVRQTATKDGVVQWELEADAAELEAEPGKMVLQSPQVHFYLDDGSKVRLTAQKGILFTRNNDMLVQGNVFIYNDRYTLKTEALAYQHGRRILKADVPVRIAGQAIDLQAATMTYDLNKNQAEFIGQVKGVLHENSAI